MAENAMSAVALAECTCSLWTPENNDVRLCAEHHRYFRGKKELAAVSAIIKACWPLKKNFEKADPDVLEHARERGIRVDALFSEYIRSGHVRIRAGEWQEVAVALRALIDWWNIEGSGYKSKAQVILADGEIAGTADVVAENCVFDIKVVSAIDPTYELQLGAYGELGNFNEGYLVHCKVSVKDMTASVRCIPVEMKNARSDFRALRSVWEMARRRTS